MRKSSLGRERRLVILKNSSAVILFGQSVSTGTAVLWLRCWSRHPPGTCLGLLVTHHGPACDQRHSYYRKG